MANVKKINRTNCYCIALRRAANVITEYYDAEMAAVGISVGQYSILVNLSRMDTASTSELAEKISLDRSTLVRNLKPLMARGLIVDFAKAGERNRRLRVSEKGAACLQKARPVWDAAQKGIEAFLGAENAELLLELLHKCQDLGG